MLAAWCLLGTATTVLAGDFTVTPVRLHFKATDRAIAVTITNNADSPLTLQADLYEWRQDETGKDILEPTEALFLSPPIVTIPPNSRQMVRLARLAEEPSEDDATTTFRMIIREIPETNATKGVNVQIALAFSLPVFIPPVTQRRELACRMTRLPSDKLQAICTNKGNVHALITHFQLSGPAGQALLSEDIGGGYVLPGATRRFELKQPHGKSLAGSGQLEVQLDDLSRSRHAVTLSD